MKRLILFFTLTLVTMSIYATAQDGDVIYVDGVKWELLGKYVYANRQLSLALYEALPKERCIRSDNWSGYTAYWSIQQDNLCLDSILYETYDSTYETFYSTPQKKFIAKRLPTDTLVHVFKHYYDGKRIVATWLNGKIRMAKGKVLCYEHIGFDRHYETERIISIEQGKVTGTTDYQNHVVEGFSFENYGPKHYAELREKFPLHIEQYPELADVKRLVFTVKQARVDAQGNLVECKVKVMRPGDNPRLAEEMAETMKAYHPWRVLFINGEYRAYGIENYTFPYILGEE